MSPRERILWRVADAAEAVLNRMHPVHSKDKPDHVSYTDKVLSIVARTIPSSKPHNFWHYTVIEKGGRDGGIVFQIEAGPGPFGEFNLNQAAAKRIINHLEGLVVLELMARA
jgi:hypothetical protein